MRINRKGMVLAVAAVAVAACGLVAALMLRTPAAAKQDYYDLSIRSELGLDGADVKAVQGLSAVAYAEGVCLRGTTAAVSGRQRAVTAASLSAKMTNLILTEGRMPEQADELVITDALAQETGWTLGTVVTLPEADFLKADAVLVGIVQDRWGAGQVYLPMENFADKSYDVVYVFAKGTGELAPESPEYARAVEDAAMQLEGIRTQRQQARYETLREALNQTINEEENLSHIKLDPYREQLESAKAELDEAGAVLEKAKQELDAGKAKLDQSNRELTAANSQIQASEQQLAQGKAKLEELKAQLDAAPGQLDAGKKQLDAARQQYQAGLATAGIADSAVESTLAAARTQLAGLQQTAQIAAAALAVARQGQSDLENRIAAIDQQIAVLEATTPTGESPEEIAANQQRIEAELAQLRRQKDTLSGLYAWNSAAAQGAEQNAARAQAAAEQAGAQVSGLEQLAAAKAQLAAAEAEYAAAQQAADTLSAAYKTGSQQYTDGEAQLNTARATYQSNLSLYQEKLKEAQRYELDYRNNESDYQKALQEYSDNKAEFDQQEQEDAGRLQALTAQRDGLTVPNWIVEKYNHE